MSLLFESTRVCNTGSTLGCLFGGSQRKVTCSVKSHSRGYRKSIIKFLSSHSIIHSRHSYISTYFVQGAVLLKDREVK